MKCEIQSSFSSKKVTKRHTITVFTGLIVGRVGPRLEHEKGLAALILSILCTWVWPSDMSRYHRKSTVGPRLEHVIGLAALTLSVLSRYLSLPPEIWAGFIGRVGFRLEHDNVQLPSFSLYYLGTWVCPSDMSRYHRKNRSPTWACNRSGCPHCLCII